MKFIISLFIMLISAKECDQKKAQMTTNVTTEMAERTIQDSTTVTYQAITRGFFLKIKIEGDSISYSSDNMLKVWSTYQMPNEEKEAFYRLLNETDEKSLVDLKPMSTSFQYDAAAMAYLEIAKGDEIYKTDLFDHGKPPKPIHDIVNKILSIKSMMEKQ